MRHSTLNFLFILACLSTSYSFAQDYKNGSFSGLTLSGNLYLKKTIAAHNSSCQVQNSLGILLEVFESVSNRCTALLNGRYILRGKYNGKGFEVKKSIGHSRLSFKATYINGGLRLRYKSLYISPQGEFCRIIRSNTFLYQE